MKNTTQQLTKYDQREKSIFEAALETAIEVYECEPSARSRKTKNVWARRVIYVELRNLNIGLSTIGNLFDQDHATVLHALRLHKDLLKTDKEYQGMYAKYRRVLCPKVYDINHPAPELRVAQLRAQMDELCGELISIGLNYEDIKTMWRESLLMVNEEDLMSAS